MKVMLVNGSSHLHGTTMKALEEMIRVFEADGIAMEVVQLEANRWRTVCNVKPARNPANACSRRRRQRLREEGPGGRRVCLCYACVLRAPKRKDIFLPGQGVLQQRQGWRAGCVSLQAGRIGGGCPSRRNQRLVRRPEQVFGISQMPVASSTYWNMVHGACAEDAPQDEEGMQTMRNLARNMIWMMRCFEAGKQNGVPYPQTERGAYTNFIR